ncbi:unnamed protein product [Callosobruchus maculatus]|uniref:XPG-I domain-containing protein n=1 Tax=Callosobruchus maculatus TaxID=64391 RepID=A0A653DDE6_CALMS|nr:unnamed protein product [Callosobruchus maculatus]
MGIKHLWTILIPFCERKPLYELFGRTVAVDLSCWICEAQNIADYQVQPRMYLRNLYFRTCYLLLMEVTPVFVLEGKAPELKYDTIAARNVVQFKGAKPKTDGVKTGKDRSRFHFILKQCEEMLQVMGLACIRGKGEAESMCAYLNEEGLVDGCISQDSDCFAYGAKVVYRNFSISTQGPHAASGGSVDIYDITKATKSLDFGRNKIIAMALLCGSDYNDGVQGVGKESVVKLFDTLSDEETLERLRSWKIKSDFYKELEEKLANKNICSSCGHLGKIQMHTKNGCHPCGTKTGCDPFKYKEERQLIKNELNMRSRALQDPNFPNEELINEYLVKKDNVSKLNIEWKKPNLIAFVTFARKFLDWDDVYSFEKFLPVLTRWQCLNADKVRNMTGNHGCLIPRRIKKVRCPKGIPSYEIIWSDPYGMCKELLAEDEMIKRNLDPDKVWATIEPQSLVDKAYPNLVEEFRLSKIKPKKVSKRKKELAETSISEPVMKKERKPKAKKKLIKDVSSEDLERSFGEMRIQKYAKKPTLLDNFLKKQMFDVAQIGNLKEFGNSNDCCTSTPAKLKENNKSVIFDISDIDDYDDDLSEIINNIVSKKPSYIEENLNKINLEQIETVNLLNSSSFFITGPVENDAFEQSLNVKDQEESEESTDEYDIDDVLATKLDDRDNDENKPIADEDSFSEVYVPLMERLKKKL